MTEPSMIRPIIHHLSPLILSFTVRWYHGASDNAPEGLSMKLLLGLSCLLTVVLAVCAQAAERPKITGIANIAVKVDNLDEARKFYSGVVAHACGCAAGIRPGQGSLMIASRRSAVSSVITV